MWMEYLSDIFIGLPVAPNFGMVFLRRKKWRTAHPEGVACPTPPSMGPISAGRGRVISGHPANRFGSQKSSKGPINGSQQLRINSYINQDAKRWWLTRLLNDWDPSSPITPTTLSGSSLQVLTTVWMKVLSAEWVLETGTESAWLGIDWLDRVDLILMSDFGL